MVTKASLTVLIFGLQNTKFLILVNYALQNVLPNNVFSCVLHTIFDHFILEEYVHRMWMPPHFQLM